MNISFMELVVIFGLALLLFGPEQLPQIARQVGKVLGDLRKGSAAIRREWYNAVYPPAQELKREITRYSSEINTLGREVLATPESVHDEKQKAPAASTLSSHSQNVPENSRPEEQES